MGFVIESPALAQKIEATLEHSLADGSYEVRLLNSGQLEWIERQGEHSVRYRAEPGTSVWRRVWISFLALLPIDGLL